MINGQPRSMLIEWMGRWRGEGDTSMGAHESLLYILNTVNLKQSFTMSDP